MKAHRARRDANEPDIIRALEAGGWTVQKLAQRGVPDLLCYRAGVWQAFEVKTAKGKLRPTQQWVNVPILRSVEDALAWMRERGIR